MFARCAGRRACGPCGRRAGRGGAGPAEDSAARQDAEPGRLVLRSRSMGRSPCPPPLPRCRAGAASASAEPAFLFSAERRADSSFQPKARPGILTPALVQHPAGRSATAPAPPARTARRPTHSSGVPTAAAPTCDDDGDARTHRATEGYRALAPSYGPTFTSTARLLHDAGKTSKS